MCRRKSKPKFTLQKVLQDNYLGHGFPAPAGVAQAHDATLLREREGLRMGHDTKKWHSDETRDLVRVVVRY